MTVVGIGRDLTAARVAAEAGATAISWDGLQRRHDIALAAPMTAAVA
jgi:phosphoribosylamine-glycine ligase